MNRLLFVLSTLLVPASFAQGLSASDIRERLEVRADIYIVDSTGQHIVDGPMATNYWKTSPERGKIEGDWSSQFKEGMLAFHQSFAVENDGSLRVSLQQFTSEDKTKLSGPLEKKDFIVKNLEPVVWIAKNSKDPNKNFVVRFIPSLRNVHHPVSVENLPIGGSSISISDDRGFLWAENEELSGNYIAFRTHRGSLALSYKPFKGAKEMGVAEGSEIVLSPVKGLKITMRAKNSFLPDGVTAKVYAIYRPEKKSKGFRSVHSYSSNEEGHLLESLNRD